MRAGTSLVSRRTRSCAWLRPEHPIGTARTGSRAPSDRSARSVTDKMRDSPGAIVGATGGGGGGEGSGGGGGGGGGGGAADNANWREMAAPGRTVTSFSSATKPSQVARTRYVPPGTM